MRHYRRRVRVIGPASPGHIQGAVLRVDGSTLDFHVVLPLDHIPEHLRPPNSEFVGVFARNELLRVEPDGEAWIEIQDGIRGVLNADWDPMGVALVTPYEYEELVEDLYWMLRRGATEDAISSHLVKIEWSYLYTSGDLDRCQRTAARLRSLQLPQLDLPEPSP